MNAIVSTTVNETVNSLIDALNIATDKVEEKDNAISTLRVQVEALTKERNAARIERDALAAAGERAFKALCRINDVPIHLEHGERLSLAKAIAALKKAGVQ